MNLLVSPTSANQLTLKRESLTIFKIWKTTNITTKGYSKIITKDMDLLGKC